MWYWSVQAARVAWNLYHEHDKKAAFSDVAVAAHSCASRLVYFVLSFTDQVFEVQLFFFLASFCFFPGGAL